MMTTLIFIPPDSGRRLSFVTGFSSGFQLSVNNQLVIKEGKTTGTIDILGSGKWVNVKMQYRKSGNQLGSTVP